MGNNLWQLYYEQRKFMAEYRDAPWQLALARYDIEDLDQTNVDIRQRLEAIETVRKTKRELVAEYRTPLQVRHYVKLTNDPKYVKGPKWEDLRAENTEITKPIKGPHLNAEKDNQNEPQTPKTIKQN